METLARLVKALAPGLGLAAVLLGAHAAASRRGRKKGRERKRDPLWEACGLQREEVERFSRQLVLPKLRVEGQQALLRARVLVVGAGGLGCPVALYLCAAGVGSLGIVDNDTVAVSNLHRQVGHCRDRVGQNKAESLRRTCLSVNDLCNVVAHPRRLSNVSDATELIRSHDLIIDCTDSPASRYLLNDAALAAGRPLLAASAVGMSGQLAVYGLPDGPCLRCVFPTPPGSTDAAEPVANCEEHGVLGPICGLVGTLAALEAVKLLASGPLEKASLKGRLLLLDAMDPSQPCRSMRIKRRQGCHCSEASAAPPAALPVPACGFCSGAASQAASGMGISPTTLRSRLESGQPTAVLDVRQPMHFAVAHLAGSSNWPLSEMRGSPEELKSAVAAKLPALAAPGGSTPLIVCACRRGNDSLLATRRLREAGIETWNLDGGLLGFAAGTDAGFEPPALT